jgi:DNA-directed RNA polymerase specialized sigma24 family protein
VDEKKRSGLMAALEKLPMRQKEVIQLLFFESHSYEDTSNIMGINIQSVYTLAWKAISNLKKTILSLLLMLNLYH